MWIVAIQKRKKQLLEKLQLFLELYNFVSSMNGNIVYYHYIIPTTDGEWVKTLIYNNFHTNILNIYVPCIAWWNVSPSCVSTVFLLRFSDMTSGYQLPVLNMFWNSRFRLPEYTISESNYLHGQLNLLLRNR